ncbi:hypothetical protein EIP91_008703 [Steccherinum ochraceum]|uniref:MYND-type domain-containing protein n=1 Tax=Steccherinum ochraceum TaxID=92696 RepID=A0A4R0RFV5_9APHY|nr:hypothetical protein EIP91_008703 [Steccherinum ochraceum]
MAPDTTTSTSISGISGTHESTDHPPRYAPALPLDGDVELPALKHVLEDVALLEERLDAGLGIPPPGERTDSLFVDTEDAPGAVQEYCGWHEMYPSLFDFSITVMIADVPPKLLSYLIWVHRLLLAAYVEAPLEDLKRYWVVLQDEATELDMLDQMFAIRERLIEILRLADSDGGRIEEILHSELERQVDTLDKKWHLERQVYEGQRQPWKDYPEVYASYAEARVLTNRFDPTTKKMLELIKDVYKEATAVSERSIWFSYTIPIHLAQTLKRLGMEPAKQREYTDIAVRYLRLHRDLRPRLAKFLERPNEPPHPVSVALGKSWFKDRPFTDKEIEKSYRRCNRCGDQGPEVKLSWCTQCKQVYYCSKACQQAHWPEHKVYCRGIATYSAEANERGELQSSKIMAEFRQWNTNYGHYANHEALLCSMKMQEDVNRGRTHVVVRILEHLPHSQGPRFRVDKWGTFAFDDVLPDLSFLLRKSEQELRALRARIFDAVDQVAHAENPPAPLMFVDGIVAESMSTTVCARIFSETMRTGLKGHRPVKMLLPEGVSPSSSAASTTFEEAQTELTRLCKRKAAGLGPDPWYPTPGMQLLAKRLPPEYTDLRQFWDWLFTFPDFFSFCMRGPLCHISDESFPQVIWYLEIALRALSTTPVEVLKQYHMLERHCADNRDEIERVRGRLVSLYVRPVVGRYNDAITEVELQIEAHKTYLKEKGMPEVDMPWEDKSDLCRDYATSRMMTNVLDVETKKLLEIIIAHEDAHYQSRLSVILRIHLALVLQHLGVELDKAAALTEWCANFLRSRRSLQSWVSPLFKREAESAHPVLLALGENWLNEKDTDRERRHQGRICYGCGLSELWTILSQCDCKQALYCSERCQRDHWRQHRYLCKHMMQIQQQSSSLSRADRRVVKDFLKWNKIEDPRSRDAFIQALGLNQHACRSRLLVAIRTLDYVPDAEALRDRFTVAELGVYRVEDAIEGMMMYLRMSEEGVRELLLSSESIIGGVEPKEDKQYRRCTCVHPVVHVTKVRNVDVPGAAGFFCRYTTLGVIEDVTWDRSWRKRVNADGVEPTLPALPGNPRDMSFNFKGTCSRLDL